MANEDKFIKLVIATIAVIAIKSKVEVLLRALAVSDSIICAWHCPEIRSYPDMQTSQVLLFVFRHFWQLTGMQLRIVNLMSFWTEPDIPLITTFMLKLNSVSVATSGAKIDRVPDVASIVTQEGTTDVM